MSWGLATDELWRFSTQFTPEALNKKLERYWRIAYLRSESEPGTMRRILDCALDEGKPDIFNVAFENYKAHPKFEAFYLSYSDLRPLAEKAENLGNKEAATELNTILNGLEEAFEREGVAGTRKRLLADDVGTYSADSEVLEMSIRSHHRIKHLKEVSATISLFGFGVSESLFGSAQPDNIVRELDRGIDLAKKVCSEDTEVFAILGKMRSEALEVRLALNVTKAAEELKKSVMWMAKSNEVSPRDVLAKVLRSLGTLEKTHGLIRTGAAVTGNGLEKTRSKS